MSKHAYTEKWYQAAHCILDAMIVQDIYRGFKPGEITVLGSIDFQRSYKSDFTGLIYRRLTERNGCLKDKNIIINLETLTTSEKPNDRK